MTRSGEQRAAEVLPTNVPHDVVVRRLAARALTGVQEPGDPSRTIDDAFDGQLTDVGD